MLCFLFSKNPKPLLESLNFKMAPYYSFPERIRVLARAVLTQPPEDGEPAWFNHLLSHCVMITHTTRRQVDGCGAMTALRRRRRIMIPPNRSAPRLNTMLHPRPDRKQMPQNQPSEARRAGTPHAVTVKPATRWRGVGVDVNQGLRGERPCGICCHPEEDLPHPPSTGPAAEDNGVSSVWQVLASPRSSVNI